MNNFAYARGVQAALEKYGGASATPPANDGASAYRDSGSPVATTSFRGMSRTIDQGWQANVDRGFTSTFTEPGFRNHILQGGVPLKQLTTDVTGGLGEKRDA